MGYVIKCLHRAIVRGILLPAKGPSKSHSIQLHVISFMNVNMALLHLHWVGLRGVVHLL